MKYLLWGPGRTGSILYSTLINSYINAQTGEIDNIRFIQTGETPIWDKPIVHTHMVDLTSFAPDDFQRIVTTRSLLDTTLSVLLAEHVNKHTISTDKDREEYVNRYTDYRFDIDPIKFFHRLSSDSRNYKRVFTQLKKDNVNYIELDYETYAFDYKAFYEKLGLSWEYNSDNILVNHKMPVNKFKIISNLTEIVELYTNIKKQFDIYDFSDNITIDNIRSHSSTG